jgi:hypothetical protein
MPKVNISQVMTGFVHDPTNNFGHDRPIRIMTQAWVSVSGLGQMTSNTKKILLEQNLELF